MPISVKSFAPPLNGRSTLIHLSSNGPVYVATLAMFAQDNEHEYPPNLSQWQNLLINSRLAGPREKAATVPNNNHKLITGRVSGVQRGDLWQAYFANYPGNKEKFSIPQAGHAVCFPISAVTGGNLVHSKCKVLP